MLLD
jgi:hypothetical protein